jgi:formamidopyrimidine-DNA glycosylase
MPELPEVETIKRGLEKYLVGHTIIDVKVNTPKVFAGDAKALLKGKIETVRRFAKVLCLDLTNGFSIVAHIKLTGQFIYRGPKLKNPPDLSKKIVGGVPGPHTHVIFSLDKGGNLYYNDVRRFGWIKVVKTREVEEIPFIKKLGPEPFGKLTFEYFNSLLCKSVRPIKIVLMDQEKIGGVGNIYANDALWLAKINPKKPANSLDEDQKKELYDAVHKVLKEGIKYGGSSELAYVTPEGKEGSYQDYTLAYGRQGELCSRCRKAKFVKYFLGGRGTYACPICQK